MDQHPLARPMIRKTMRVGEVRTSIKLEAEFWDFLREMAGTRGLSLSALTGEIVAGLPAAGNRASTLRVWALAHATRGR